MNRRSLKIILYLLLGFTLFSSTVKFFNEDNVEEIQSLQTSISKLKVDLKAIKPKLDQHPELTENYQEIEFEINKLESRLATFVKCEEKGSSFDLREDVLDPLFIIVLISILPKISNLQNKTA